MNHLNYIALHIGISPEKAPFPHAAPPLTCSLSVMVSVSLRAVCALGNKSSRKERLLPWSDCNRAKSYCVSFYLGPFFWIPMFLKSWAQGRGHQLHQTRLCGYPWSQMIMMAFESRWLIGLGIEGKAGGWRHHHKQNLVFHRRGGTMDTFRGLEWFGAIRPVGRLHSCLRN